MALLSKDAILAADDRPTETVPVPEWGGEVRVRGLDGRGRDEYFASMAVQTGGRRAVLDTRDSTAKLAARCIVGDDGQPLFTLADVEALTRKSGAALDRVFSVAQRLSGLSEEDMAELGKGSANGQTGGSVSASPVTSAARSRSSSR